MKDLLSSGKVEFRLPVKSPFILAAHHYDEYPKGNGRMEPESYPSGRVPGADFEPNAPWRMYHGDRIPGFPAHPHRGFETVTIVEKGFVDHTDGAGSEGRYGEGDVQWMTAGSGMQHCEMFPLVHSDKPNTLELFQLWLNLPAQSKMVEPSYKMLWSEDIPVVEHVDEAGRTTRVKVVAGRYGDTKAPDPTPDSWASEKDGEVTIWVGTMEPGALFTIRSAAKGVNRVLYFYRGESLAVNGETLGEGYYAELADQAEIGLENGSDTGFFLLLEGRPIDEPVAAYGPFVMNTEQEILEAYEDFQKTRFGGWPFDAVDPVHSPDSGRYARYSDGRCERR